MPFATASITIADLVARAIDRLSPADRAEACRLLANLNGPGCRSGSAAFGDALDALSGLGVIGANMIFEHDRARLIVRFTAPVPFVKFVPGCPVTTLETV
jgi:hypothetical protein